MSASTQPHYKRVESAFLAHEFLPKTREGITVNLVINKENNIHCGIEFSCGKIKISISELWEVIEINNEGWDISFPTANWNQNLKGIKKMVKHAKDSSRVDMYEEFAGMQLENGELRIEEYGFTDFDMKIEFDNNETVAFLEMIVELMEEWLDVVDFVEHEKGRNIKAVR